MALLNAGLGPLALSHDAFWRLTYAEFRLLWQAKFGEGEDEMKELYEELRASSPECKAL